jgi:hypothetical protein
VVSLAILYSIQFTFGLRVSELDEKLGLDITTHGEVIDNPEELIGSKKQTSKIYYQHIDFKYGEEEEGY